MWIINELWSVMCVFVCMCTLWFHAKFKRVRSELIFVNFASSCNVGVCVLNVRMWNDVYVYIYTVRMWAYEYVTNAISVKEYTVTHHLLMIAANESIMLFAWWCRPFFVHWSVHNYVVHLCEKEKKERKWREIGWKTDRQIERECWTESFQFVGCK